MNTLSAVAVLIFANTLLLGQTGQTSPTPQSRERLPGVPASSSALSSGLPVPAPGPPVSASSTPAAPVYGFNLTYADTGNIVQAQDLVNGTWNYTYDDFNRLLTATTPTSSGPGQSFDYDAYGNRWHENVTQGQAQSKQLVFDNSNRIIGGGVTYDTLGNVIDDGFHKYTYDAENRLVKVDANPDGSAAAVTYTYDAFGRRLSKTAPGGATEFLYDLAGRVIAER